MRPLILFRKFLEILVLLSLTAKASQSRDDPMMIEPAAPLPGPWQLRNLVDLAEIVTVPLPSRTSGRQITGGLFNVRYSRKAIKSTLGNTLISIPVRADDLRETLQTAIANARTHSPSETQTYFVSTAKGLSVIVKSIIAAPDRDAFNWQDFSSVASVLLKATPEGDKITDSFVGVVVNSEGKSIVDVAVIPAFGHVHSNKIRSLPDSALSITDPKLNMDSPSRLEKRVTYPIPGTALTMQSSVGMSRVNALALRLLVLYAIDMVMMNDSDESYSTITATLTDRISTRYGQAAFSVRALNGQKISLLDMMAIILEMHDLVGLYLTTNENPAGLYRALVGKVLKADGMAIAHWSIGEPMGSPTECGLVVVQHPDESQVLGCLAT
ncbi:hypothetical protein MMC16_003500 [Acarospora aff. strigata]|nr:hypothetical protein [Acarospora aff. strigata]